jgi:hypothetical protein
MSNQGWKASKLARASRLKKGKPRKDPQHTWMVFEENNGANIHYLELHQGKLGDAQVYLCGDLTTVSVQSCLCKEDYLFQEADSGVSRMTLQRQAGFRG